MSLREEMDNKPTYSVFLLWGTIQYIKKAFKISALYFTHLQCQNLESGELL